MFRTMLIPLVFIVLSCSANGDMRDPDYVQVYIVPMSDFPEPLAVQLAKTLSEDLGFWIKSSLRIGKLAVDVMPGTNQLPAEEILTKSQQVVRSFPEASAHTYFLLLTLRDINSQTMGFRFQFSMHDKDLRTSVLSMARLFDYQNNQPVINNLAVSRLFKMAKRSVGEMHLGWERSTNPNDVMYSPLMSTADLDRIGINHFEGKDNHEPVPTQPSEQGSI